MSGKATSQGMTSRFAATVEKQKGKLGPIGWAMLGATVAIAFVPIVGPMFSHVVDRKRNSMEATSEKKALTNWYRHQIANQLQVPPEEVTHKDLHLAAQVNPTFKGMVDKIETEQHKHNRASLIGGVLGTPLSFVGAGGLAKGTEIAITAGASMGSYALGPEHIYVDEVADHVNQKRLNGEAVEMGDVFSLRLAHNKELQDAIHKQHGMRFQKMSPEQQAAVMKTMPDMMQAAEREAYAVNQGLISEQDLVVAARSAPQQGFSAGAQPRSQQQGFRARVEAQRSAAANTQMQPA